MSEYLSKEEIKQWRSSLEKITLEEYAARLGKKLEQEKQTKDIVDIVLKGQPVVSKIDDWSMTRSERITTIAQRAFDVEKKIAPTPFSIENLKASSIAKKKKVADKKETKSTKETKLKKETKTKAAKTKAVKALKTKVAKPKAEKKVVKPKKMNLREEVRIVLNKSLTDREQRVFDYFLENKNQIVYAKDLAVLLELPRDYVYKYIKNLRAKIDGDKLQNADKGGFILNA